MAILLVQLFVSASLIQVKGGSIPAAASDINPQSHSYSTSLTIYFEDCWHGIWNWFNYWNKQYHSGQHSALDHITISPKTSTIVAGQSQTYSATAYDQHGNSWSVSTNPGIVWSINSGAGTFVWTGSSVQVTKAGTWIVTATYKGKSDTASLTVTHANVNKLDHITASVNPGTVEAPNTVVGTATAYDIYGNSWDISSLATWSIPVGNDGGSWTKNVYTSHTAGTYAVQASYYGKLATASLTVTHSTNPSNLASISISPPQSSVAAGQTQSYTATATDTYGNSWDITSAVSAAQGWSITFGAGGSWNGATYTSQVAGSWTVTAVYLTMTAAARLTVNANHALLSQIIINPHNANTVAGGSQSFTVEAYDQFGNDLGDVTASATFTVNNITITRNQEAATAVGSYTVVATYQGLTDTATLNVAAGPLDYIVISPQSPIASAGTPVTFSTAGFDQYGNDLGPVSASYSVSASPITGNQVTETIVGQYLITATHDGMSDSTTLTIIAAAFDHVTISPVNASILAGTVQAYTVSSYDQYNNYIGDVTASASFTVSGVSIPANTVSETAAGSYNVEASYGGQTASTTLTVTVAPLDYITLSPASSSIAAGQSQTYSVTAYDSYGNSWDITSAVSGANGWSISIGAGGSWNQATGTYTSTNAGTWTVTATLGELSATATLIVNANPALLDHITINPKTPTITAGSQSFTVTAYDQFGNSLGDVTTQATFDAPGASVTGNTVTSGNAGSYTVTATYSGLTDTASLTVTGYTVTFAESGLPTGTSWSITFAATVYSSTTATITINELSAQSYSWSTSSNVQNGQTRYITAETSASLSIPSQLTQSIDYSTQYLVTYSTTGNVLLVSVPAAEWVNASGQATGLFPTQVINEAQDTRCNFISDNRPESITQPTTITGTYQTQYYLTVISLYSTTSGEGWYDSGSIATASLSSAKISGGSNVQYVFSNWSGDASGTALTCSIIMINPKTATASWNTQYLVTYAVTGNVLTINVPTNEWVSYGGTAQGKFVPTVVNSANNTQCLFLNDNRTQSITQPTTITGEYQTQYKITFNQTGVQSDAKGTIVTISDIPEDYSQLANINWVDNGTQLTFSFEAKVATTSANKVYSLTSVNASSPVTIEKPTYIQGTYKAQNSSSLYTILEFALIIFAFITVSVSLLTYRRRRKKKALNLNEIGKA